MEAIKRRIVDQSNLTDHERKNLTILEVLRRKGPLARADIARETRLNNVTVTSYIDQYLKKDILQEAGTHVSTGGRKPTLVDLDPTYAFAIGVGLNAVHYIAVLTNLKGQILREVKISRTMESQSDPLKSFVDVISRLIKESNVDLKKVHGIGIGVPGIVNSNNGTVRWPRGLVNSDFSISTSISNRIYEAFKLPVILDNDANAAVFGEQWMDQDGLNVSSAVYLYSGSGCGLLLNGHIYRGATGAAGEFLFDMVNEDPIGWLKNAVDSGQWGIDLGITAKAKEVLQAAKSPKLTKLCGGDAKKIQLYMVAECAQSGDAACREIVEMAGKALGHRAAMVTNLLNPELLIVGGGLESLGVVFLDALKNHIKTVGVPESGERLKVVASKLGDKAVPLGAAALVIQNFFISN